jgi:ATP-dependent DNA ligase
MRRPSGFIEPCLPSKVARPPFGPLWVHELKHDGYRLMVRRDGARVAAPLPARTSACD